MGIDKVKFGKRLRLLIDKSGLKYYVAAEKIGISLSHLNKVMNGQRDFSFKLVRKICEGLDINQDDLLEKELPVRIKDMTAEQLIEKVNLVSAPETRAQSAERQAKNQAGHASLREKISLQSLNDKKADQLKADLVASINIELTKKSSKELLVLEEVVQGQNSQRQTSSEAEVQIAKLKSLFGEKGLQALLTCKRLVAEFVLEVLQTPVGESPLTELLEKLSKEDRESVLRKVANPRGRN